jgi:hypothetical protein
MQIISPEKIDSSRLPKIKHLFNRPVGTIEEESVAHDRIIIDDYIMGDILGLSLKEQEEVREAVKDLVKTRLQKARSLKKIKKTKEGIDLNLLAQNILRRLEDDNLVTFYKKQITSVPCYSIGLPERAEPIEVENFLFGWCLKSGKKVIDCSSEAEARYKRIFLEMGWDRAMIPKDNVYLSSIINRWETLFEKTQTVLQEHTSSILQKKTRDLLIYTVWSKLREQMS